MAIQKKRHSDFVTLLLVSRRMMDIVSTVLKRSLCLLDEVVVFSKTYDGHLAQLSSVSAAIKKAGLRL